MSRCKSGVNGTGVPTSGLEQREGGGGNYGTMSLVGQNREVRQRNLMWKVDKVKAYKLEVDWRWF